MDDDEMPKPPDTATFQAMMASAGMMTEEDHELRREHARAIISAQNAQVEIAKSYALRQNNVAKLFDNLNTVVTGAFVIGFATWLGWTVVYLVSQFRG